MKSLVEFIHENKKADLHTATVQKKLAKSMTDQDKSFAKFLYKDEKNNNVLTMEDVEKLLWKIDDQVIDDYYNHVTEILKYVDFTPEQVVNTYSLARSGKQKKIEVIAQVGHFAYQAIS